MSKQKNNERLGLWLNTTETLKLEATITSFVYVVYGLLLTAAASHNSLLFSLAAPNKPNAFIPYWPIFNNLMYFSVLGVLGLFFGFLGEFISEKYYRSKNLLFIMHIACFLISMAVFTYQIYSMRYSFYFH